MEHDFESLSVSLECDFENFDSCGWHNVDTDDQDWTVHSGKTPSSRTGPKGDFSDSGTWRKQCFVHCKDGNLWIYLNSESFYIYHNGGEAFISILSVFFLDEHNVVVQIKQL